MSCSSPTLAVINQTIKMDIKVHAVFKRLLNRAHVTVEWMEVEGLKATNKRKTVLKQFERRAHFPIWVEVQEQAGFKVTVEEI